MNSTSQSVLENSSTSSRSSMTPKSENENETLANICPFKLKWNIGINPNVPLLNLTTENRMMIAYACSHAVMLYDYESKDTVPLQGHQNEVAALSISRKGKWLLTADFGDDSALIIWDTETGVPVRSLFNPHGQDGMTAARISPNAKYVVTVGNEKCQKVCFWLWTHGRNKADACYELRDTPADRVKEICFSDDRCEAFSLTTDNYLIFFLWEGNELKYCLPKLSENKRRIGVINCSCYVTETRKIVTGTTNGFLLVWGNPLANEGSSYFTSVKILRSQRCSITAIAAHERKIVTGNSMGRINFYDTELKILYWCKDLGLDGIKSISFNLQSRLGPILAKQLSDIKFRDFSELEEDVEENYFDEEVEEVIEYEEFCGRDCEERGQCWESTSTLDQNKFSSALAVNIEPTVKDSVISQSVLKAAKYLDQARDATLENLPFTIENFVVCTSSGSVALIDISKLKCYFILPGVNGSITSLDAHPESNYLVTGNTAGFLSLYNYQERKFILSRRTPPLPNFKPILETQAVENEIIYVTCPSSHENLISITELKYSPTCDILACGMESGAIWMLHPITLDPLEEIPYKHSCQAITKIIFAKCSEYMAYSDDALLVAVFKKNDTGKKNLWNFIGKYHSHYMTIRDILFAPPATDGNAPRLFSLGEDRDLIEYDLENSGPYPNPGLQILQINQAESRAIPLCLSWYPIVGDETFLIIPNSEYKYRLVHDMVKSVRGTFLGPTFGAPVQHLQVIPETSGGSSNYMIFVTDKEIGLQLLPFDGNPYNSLGIIAHSRKVKKIALNCDGDILFTAGYNDPCILMWEIRIRSIDIMSRLGGDGLDPFYCLLEGGKKGWFLKEIQDLFYYAQILHQGENTTATRVVSDQLATKQIPNLLQAIGFYPSTEELEIIMAEVSYKNYAKTGQLLEDITFEDFVKLYINHRPVFGITMRELQGAFRTLAYSNEEKIVDEENPTLTRTQLLNILIGKGTEEENDRKERVYGDPLTRQEVFLYLKLLCSSEEDFSIKEEGEISLGNDFDFLPKRISYKEFITDVVGIELPEEMRADSE